MTEHEQLLNQLDEAKKALKDYNNKQKKQQNEFNKQQRKKDKYQNGKIYKITCNVFNIVYVGSTVTSLRDRLYKHKNNYKSYCNGNYHYQTSFKVLENDDYDIELIEDYPCESLDELLKREGYWIKKIDCCNKQIAGRKKKQYYQDNKEIINEKNKERYANNKEVQESAKKRTKEWYQNNKDKATEYHKQYREKHREEKKEYFKEYYQKNKHKANEYYHNNKHKLKGNEKIECECGGSFLRRGKSRHLKSKTHQNYLNTC